MGLPDVVSNYKGYAESDVYDKVEHLRNKMFYLVHGTADDNVQFQQSMALARHLAKKGILFRQQVLTDYIIYNCSNLLNNFNISYILNILLRRYIQKCITVNVLLYYNKCTSIIVKYINYHSLLGISRCESFISRS